MKDLDYMKLISQGIDDDDIYYVLQLYHQWIDDKDREIKGLKEELKFYRDWADENDAHLEAIQDEWNERDKNNEYN
jgi:hypothetical protein